MSTAQHSNRRRTWGDIVIAKLLATGYLVLLLGTTKSLGYTRDEGFYFQAATSYGRWFADLFAHGKHALDPRAVDAAWSTNHEHPGLIKGLFALSNLVLQQRFHLFSADGTSFRFPGMALASLGVGLTYLWAARASGRVGGLTAAFALAMMPRFFFHAHLACFDAPVVTMWMLCVYTYARTLDSKGALWPILTGIAFGLALDTKHNAWFVPFLLVTHAVVGSLYTWLVGAPWKRHASRAATALAAMASLGPLVFWALWPWIWHDTKSRLAAYASFHLNHEYYNMEFLGQNYWKPPMPRGYAPLMTLATVPTITLLLAALGVFFCARTFVVTTTAAIAARRRGEKPACTTPFVPGSNHLLWFGAAAISYAAWLSPQTPIFGGTKHWMTAYPFLALFAGVAAARIVVAARVAIVKSGSIRRQLGRKSAIALAHGPIPAAALGASFVIAPVTETLRSHPYGLAAYTPLVGGAPGAASLGLNRSFWGYATGAVAPAINASAPRSARVYLHDTAGQSWDMLQRDGRIRPDLRAVWSIADADIGLYHHELHMEGQEYQNWVAFGSDRPSEIGRLDGVPVIVVYQRNPR